MKRFVDAIIEGYDGAAPEGFGIDRARFERMLQLRKAFYSRREERGQVHGSLFLGARGVSASF